MDVHDRGEQGPDAPAGGDAPQSAPDAATAPKPAAIPRRELLIGVMVAAGVLVITLGVLMARDVKARDAAPGTPSAARPSSARAAEGAAASAPKWSGDNRTMWVGNRKNGVAYEVATENEINVWMRKVRPMLVVRCVGGEAEVFVLTDSPIQMAANTEDHAVSFSLDDGAETKELWPDSSTHDALFAPDGDAFARRLMASRTLSVGFTPHNAQPAVVRFHVAGLEPLLTPAAKECGWKK